jgi:hypothetical protein
MPNTPEALFTGMFTFPSVHEPDKKQFGMVGCTADPDGSNGAAIICLHLGESGIAYENVGSSLKITIPEAEIRTLLPIVERALQRLQDLRISMAETPPG